jgi:hypothetical protein
VADGVDGRRRAVAPELDVRYFKARSLSGGQTGHLQAGLGVGDPVRGFVRRDG